MYKNIKNKPKRTPVLVWQEGGLYIAKSLDLDVVSQGSTKEESLASLKEMIEQYFSTEISIASLFSDKITREIQVAIWSSLGNSKLFS